MTSPLSPGKGQNNPSLPRPPTSPWPPYSTLSLPLPSVDVVWGTTRAGGLVPPALTGLSGKAEQCGPSSLCSPSCARPLPSGSCGGSPTLPRAVCQESRASWGHVTPLPLPLPVRVRGGGFQHPSPYQSPGPTRGSGLAGWPFAPPTHGIWGHVPPCVLLCLTSVRE